MWIKRYHNNGAFQQNFSISVWRDLCQLSVWSICGYCYYQRAVWELSSVRYNIPAHCLALLLILIPANQKLWCHAFLCLSTNFRWLTKDLYYHTPDRHMLFKLKKKRSWKTKAFLNDLDIPETSDLRKKDIEEEVVLELWVILENFRMGPLPKMSNLWLGKSWQVYVMLCYQFFGLSSSVGHVVILLAGYHCCNPQWYATTNIQLTQEITSFIA